MTDHDIAVRAARAAFAYQCLNNGIGPDDHEIEWRNNVVRQVELAGMMRAAIEAVAPAIRAEGQPLQSRVAPWMQACFGAEIAADTVERRHRFVEEALELLQAMGGTKHEAIQLVDYVFSREKGEPHQEIGGVMITLAALCLAAGLDMHKAGEDELARIWTKVDVIRAKQAAKPKHSVLPVAVEPRSDRADPRRPCA
jgi:NTP pyrophosphatase (non-canonical NTP hydrolase)